MWILLWREPRPDALVWPGRRMLAAIDALAWPLLWIVVARHLPEPAGVVEPVVIALAMLSAIGRVNRALWSNERYWFTTWRWGRIVAGLMLIGVVMKLAVSV